MITINYRDPRPIYVQVMNSLQKLIVSGVIAPDEKMPSVRELAQSLAINPNTIQRAYRELEGRGYIYSIAGKGSFAAHKMDVDEGRKKQLLKTLGETVKELRYLGVSEEDIEQYLKGGSEE
ncbi:MAG: GntR family transcriptional regulator [Ruminococcaceae bacterium]|nr:GntR family transcriptional regulator [Oscillospiraceae bacterium]